MKSVIKIIVLLCTFTIGNAQEPKHEILVDRFLEIPYDKDQICLKDEGISVANFVGEKIKTTDVLRDFSFMLSVGTCVFEKEHDSLIGYKRVDFLLNYLKQNYNIDSEIFLIEFYDYDMCDVKRETDMSIITFSLFKCN